MFDIVSIVLHIKKLHFSSTSGDASTPSCESHWKISTGRSSKRCRAWGPWQIEQPDATPEQTHGSWCHISTYVVWITSYDIMLVARKSHLVAVVDVLFSHGDEETGQQSATTLAREGRDCRCAPGWVTSPISPIATRCKQLWYGWNLHRRFSNIWDFPQFANGSEIKSRDVVSSKLVNVGMQTERDLLVLWYANSAPKEVGFRWQQLEIESNKVNKIK